MSIWGTVTILGGDSLAIQKSRSTNAQLNSVSKNSCLAPSEVGEGTEDKDAVVADPCFLLPLCWEVFMELCVPYIA